MPSFLTLQAAVRMARTCMAQISGKVTARRHAAVAEHRVELVQLVRPSREVVDARRPSSWRAPRSARALCGRNSCSGGSSRRMVTGKPFISRKMPMKSSVWNGQQLGQRLLARRPVVGEDHLAHGGDALVLEEHVLGAAEADALGAEARRAFWACSRRVRVGAHLHAAAPSAHPMSSAELAAELRLDLGDLAHVHAAGRAVDGDHFAQVHHRGAAILAHGHQLGLVVDR